MDFGFSLPMRGPLTTPENIAALARRGEELGYRWLALPDHLVIPRSITSRYPYSGTGAFPGHGFGNCLEELTVLGWVAAITTRARLLTSVMVVPHRNPVHTAKIVATLDFLSGGRVTLGVGAGWLAEEFDAIGTEPFAERGRVTDEYLEVFGTLWTEEEPTFEGHYASFADIVFEPKPVQQPHPPIWVGGESGPALRRTVRYGDAWFPIGANPRHPLDTVGRFEAAVGRLGGRGQESGRNPGDITLAYWANWYDERKGEVTLDDGARHLFTGSAEQVAEDVRALGELGVKHLLFNFLRGDLEESLDSLQRFADEVLPLAGESLET